MVAGTRNGRIGDRIGIDVGGTFTDFVAILADGRLLHHKEPSDPSDPSAPVEAGLRALTAQGALVDKDNLIVHGTTIGLNAVLQRRGARIALVVSRGGRDVLEIERSRLPHYLNFRAPRPMPLVPRDRVLEVNLRMGSDGRIIEALDPIELDTLAERIEALDVEAVAVALLNSYIDPSQEDALAEALRARLPGLLVTRSAKIWPEIREYERTVVASLNAQIHPLMDRYLDTLSKRISALGIHASLQLSTSSGGMLSLYTARERPVETLLSGPASGVVAASQLANRLGLASSLTFDMGGTSADIAVLQDGAAEVTTSSHIGSLPLMMPVVGVSSIGAGGGSIIRVDAEGVIKVGPESAGSNPGPAAYGRGGTQATVTDCYVVLGIIDPDKFLGGRVKLDATAAEKVLTAVAEKLGLGSAAHAAEAAIAVTTAQMATELFKLLAQGGHEPARHTIIPFGGAGPTHAVFLAAEAELAGVAVPQAAATFCALGAVVADVRRSFLDSLGQTGWCELDAKLWPAWQRLEQEAEAWLAQEGVPTIGHRLEYALDMRYTGQAHNLLVTIPTEVRHNRDLHGVAEALHQAHERLYDFREVDETVEVVSARLNIVGELPEVVLPDLPASDTYPSCQSSRPVFHAGTWIEAEVFDRADLPAGSKLSGPLLVEQDDTTTWVPPGWSLQIDSSGALLITRKDHNGA